MELDEIKNVQLAGTGKYKFILAQVRKGNEEKNILRGDCLEYHSDILESLSYQIKQDITIRPLGGGRIVVNKNELHAFGYSGSYGTADQNTVQKLLEEHMEEQGLEAKLKVEMGVGY